MSTAPERLAEVRARIATAVRDARRDAAAVHLVAVSKTFGAEEILPVLEAGQRIFGENRVQEAHGKWPALRERFPDREAAAAAFVTAITALEPLLKETDEYYTQENYKDDKMAKGRALHPRLVVAWKAFEAADHRLRVDLDVLQDRQAVERLAEIERSEGRSARYHVEALMMRAKRVQNAGNTSAPEVPKLIELIAEYETIVKASEEFAGKDGQIGSSFVNASKAYLVTAKQLMRRLRDKVPYSQGEKMMMGSGGAWMIEGSPARLTRDYNQLVDNYNRGAKF